MTHFYMCLVVNIDHHEIESTSVFFKTIYEARVYGYRHAKQKRHNYVIGYDLDEWVTLGVCIFKIPFGVEVDTNDISMDSNIWQHFVITILDRQTKAAKTIQRKYRHRYIKRIDAAILIQDRFRVAIANPYTQICQNRLMREFKEMN